MYCLSRAIAAWWLNMHIKVEIFYFSILGLRYDVTDDEVKKYYRKQAVLVHPDKVTNTKCMGNAYLIIKKIH